MPATAYAALLLVASVVVGAAAVLRRSRLLGVVAALAFAVFVAYTALLFQMVG